MDIQDIWNAPGYFPSSFGTEQDGSRVIDMWLGVLQQQELIWTKEQLEKSRCSQDWQKVKKRKQTKINPNT